MLHDGDPFRLNYDNCSNPGYWQWRRTAYQAAVRIPMLLAAGFGKSNVGPGKRVRPLLSGQASQPFVMQQGLDYIERVWAPPGTLLHGIAIAPYFNLGPATNDPALGVDGIITAMAENARNQSAAAGVGEDVPNAQHAALARYATASCLRTAWRLAGVSWGSLRFGEGLAAVHLAFDLLGCGLCQQLVETVLPGYNCHNCCAYLAAVCDCN